MGLFVLWGKVDTNAGRVSGIGRKGSAAIEQLGFGNDLCLVSYHFPKPYIFRTPFHAAHWHKLLRTVCSGNIVFNKDHYEGTKSPGGTVIYSVTCLTWNRKVHCRAHKSLWPVSTPGKATALCIISFEFDLVIIIDFSIIHSCLVFQVVF